MRLHKERKTVVMVVDDSVDSIRMINDAMEEAGMTVLVALEGHQALTISENITPDIVLMDAIMPSMDGFETCRRLRENPALTDTPIIFMTGLSDTEHVVMGLKSGGVDYVTKPINTTELLARMDVHLTNARMARSARSALDKTGHNLFAVDAAGQLLWATPHVLKRLPALDSDDYITAMGALAGWLTHKPEPGQTQAFKTRDGEYLTEFLAKLDDREHLLRLKMPSNDHNAADQLRGAFQLTGRESDVLLWIAHGKTNREIGMILDMSPRTVNKHLEQIYRKLGVENRTSAAAKAIKHLGNL